MPMTKLEKKLELVETNLPIAASVDGRRRGGPSGGLLADHDSGLAVGTGPLSSFSSFTYLASFSGVPGIATATDGACGLFWALGLGALSTTSGGAPYDAVDGIGAAGAGDAAVA